MPQSASGQTSRSKIELYASIGPDLTHYDVDVGDRTMFWMGMVAL